MHVDRPDWRLCSYVYAGRSDCRLQGGMDPRSKHLLHSINSPLLGNAKLLKSPHNLLATLGLTA
jgi:hypothetical protein